MLLQELTDLIAIRAYVGEAVARDLPTIDKVAARELDSILVLIDKKIIAILADNDFKKYIGFDGVNQLRKEIRNAADGPVLEARQKMAAEKLGR